MKNLIFMFYFLILIKIGYFNLKKYIFFNPTLTLILIKNNRIEINI